MGVDSSIWSRIYEFGWALVAYWWILVPGGLLSLEPMMESFLHPSWKARLDRRWPKETRYRHFRWGATLAILIASFLAFDDLNTRTRTEIRADQVSLDTAIGERDEARRQLKELEGRRIAPQPPRVNSRLYWPPLTLEETLRLRTELREISRAYLSDPAEKYDFGTFKVNKAQVTVLCSDAYCSDLAGSIADVIQTIGITADISAPLGKLDESGISIKPDNRTSRDIAKALEKATDGRLLVVIQSSKDKEKTITMYIGKKPN
jgi:hypothetical protein